MKHSEFIKVAAQMPGFRPYHAPHGAMAGGAAGALLGGTAGLASGLLMDDEEQPPWYKRLLMGAGLGAGLGAVGGAGASQLGLVSKAKGQMKGVIEGVSPEQTEIWNKLPSGLQDDFMDLGVRQTMRYHKDTAVPWKQTPKLLRPDDAFRDEIKEYNKPMEKELATDTAGKAISIMMNHALKNKQQ